MPGGDTVFEYIKHRAVGALFTPETMVSDVTGMLGVSVPHGLDRAEPIANLPLRRLQDLGAKLSPVVAADALDRPVGSMLGKDPAATHLLDEVTLDELFRSQSVARLASAVQVRVPAGLDAAASISALRLRDLFRFISVGTMAGYVEYLVATRGQRRD